MVGEGLIICIIFVHVLLDDCNIDEEAGKRLCRLEDCSKDGEGKKMGFRLVIT